MFQRSGGYRNLLQPLPQSYLNLLLVFLPLALVAVVTPLAPDVVLIFNFLAIIPLSGLVHSACEDLSANSNPALGRLLVAFSDNLVEFVVGIVALCKGEIRLVQLSVIGSVLCYSLLIMGSCFFAHGMKYSRGSFNSFATKSITSLNLLALCCLLIPSALYPILENYDLAHVENLVLLISRGIAIILLALYIVYLLFTLKTHSDFFYEDPENYEEDASADAANWSLRPFAAITWLAVSLTCITLCTLALVSSIQGSIWEAHKSLLGFILFPFLGNVTDYLSACVVAWKNNLDITILVTIGSSMQLLLFTLPILVILGWITNEPMTLHFDFFETATVFLGVFVVNGLVQNANSNYLTGAMCIALYAIIALATFLHPDDVYSSPIPI